MAKKWAIVVGINQYKRFQPLRYAERDAQAMRDFLVRDAGFDQVYYFTDRSPKIVLGGASIATQPTTANLQRFFELQFAIPCLKHGDTLWFFFSGYGLQYANADYLMPSDAEPDASDTTAISIDAIADFLSRSGADKIVLFLDACRTEEQKFGQGFGTDPKGVVSLFSTAFGETAYEIEALQHSSFTYALLEGLSLHGRNPGTTVAQLAQHLGDRLPQVNLSYGQPSQSPRLSANASIAPEAMLLPQTMAPLTVRDEKRKPAMTNAEPKTPQSYMTLPIAFVAQHSRKILQASAATLATLALGLVGLATYQALEPYLTTPDRWTELWAETLARTTPSSAPSPATFNLKDNFYQRLPRPGTYYATTSVFSQSYREISNGNGRFCIKLVNAFSANPRSANVPGEPQLIVSTLSFRENGVYIDATQERLQVDGTFTEITDSRSTWQWAKSDVDRSGSVAECLASVTSYARGVKSAAPNKETVKK